MAFSLAFLTDDLVDAHLQLTDLFAETAVFDSAPAAPVGLQLRMRFRGVRESAKWNTFLTAQGVGQAQLESFLAAAEEEFARQQVGYLTAVSETVAELLARRTLLESPR